MSACIETYQGKVDLSIELMERLYELKQSQETEYVKAQRGFCECGLRVVDISIMNYLIRKKGGNECIDLRDEQEALGVINDSLSGKMPKNELEKRREYLSSILPKKQEDETAVESEETVANLV